MVIKTVIMLCLFLAPLLILIFGGIESVGVLFLLYILSGFGMAGIGMGIMHDAIHGSYSGNRKINKLLSYSLNMVGANAIMWKFQHNVLHHSFTNVHESDDDINTPPFLRFSPDRPLKKAHRYQYLYTWFFYALATLSWITTKDFVRLKRYYEFGLIKTEAEFKRIRLNIIGWKIAYFVYALILPMVMTTFPIWLVFLAFISMHLITGTCISLIFQIAHVMPSVAYPIPSDDGQIETNRMVHQMVTTTNFAPSNRILFWLVGGLNYQVEHHLYPNVCHVHYRKIAPIVKQTAEEFGVPYLSEPTFFGALRSHARMLYLLGREEEVTLPVSSAQSVEFN